MSRSKNIKVNYFWFKKPDNQSPITHLVENS